MYSEVKVVMKLTNFENLLEQLRLNKNKNTSKLNLLLARAEIESLGENIIGISWHEIEWSKKIIEIKMFMEFLHNLRKQNIPFSFVKLGENFGDLEHFKCLGEKDKDISCDLIKIWRELYFDN